MGILYPWLPWVTASTRGAIAPQHSSATHCCLLPLLGTGASLCAVGELVASPGAKQAVEVKAKKLVLIGSCDAETYPLQKVRQGGASVDSCWQQRVNMLAANAWCRKCWRQQWVLLTAMGMVGSSESWQQRVGVATAGTANSSQSHWQHCELAAADVAGSSGTCREQRTAVTAAGTEAY